MFRAKLSLDGIYLGVEEVAVLEESDMEVPQDCDLAPGRYKLAGPDDSNPSRHFVPLASSKQLPIETGISLDHAFYAYLTRGPADKDVQSWIDWYRTTIDPR